MMNIFCRREGMCKNIRFYDLGIVADIAASGRIDTQADGRTGGRMDVQTDKTFKRTDAQTYEHTVCLQTDWTNVLTNRRTDSWSDEQTDGRTYYADGQAYRWTYVQANGLTGKQSDCRTDLIFCVLNISTMQIM